jgi:hypothetical protein
LDDLKQQVIAHRRRLNVLKEQKTNFGLYVPPHIPLEIEDIEAKIEALEARIEAEVEY